MNKKISYSEAKSFLEQSKVRSLSPVKLIVQGIVYEVEE